MPARSARDGDGDARNRGRSSTIGRRLRAPGRAFVTLDGTAALRSIAAMSGPRTSRERRPRSRMATPRAGWGRGVMLAVPAGDRRQPPPGPP